MSDTKRIHTYRNQEQLNLTCMMENRRFIIIFSSTAITRTFRLLSIFTVAGLKYNWHRRKVNCWVKLKQKKDRTKQQPRRLEKYKSRAQCNYVQRNCSLQLSQRTQIFITQKQHDILLQNTEQGLGNITIRKKEGNNHYLGMIN